MRPKSAISARTQAATPQPGEAQSQQPFGPGPGVDARALAQMLAAARPRMHALAFRILGDSDEAEDAVQEAWIKVWRNIGRFEGRSALTTWLHRIAVNAALDRARRRPPVARDLRNEEASPDTGGSGETPERIFARAEAGAVVRRALARLPAAHGEALRLCDLEGESYAAIADAVHCPIGTVMSRLFHARRKLARELEADALGAGDLEALRAA